MKTSAYPSLRSFGTYAFISVLILTAVGCSLTKVPYSDPRCKIQAHIDERFVDYISNRFQKGSTPRIAVMPFDVPVNFSPVFDPNLRFGLNLAQNFQQNMLAQNQKMIIEIFDRAEWPGKGHDFATGNFVALRQARDAGYDFLLVGTLDKTVDSNLTVIHTKLIDTDSSTTIWYGTSELESIEKPRRNFLNFLSRGIYPMREDILHYSENTKSLCSCTVNRMFNPPIQAESENFIDAIN